MFFLRRWNELVENQPTKILQESIAHTFDSVMHYIIQQADSHALNPRWDKSHYWARTALKARPFQFQRVQQILPWGTRLFSHFFHKWRVQQTYSWFRQVTVQMPFLHYVPLLKKRESD
jgi:hypothetical protein